MPKPRLIAIAAASLLVGLLPTTSVLAATGPTIAAPRGLTVVRDAANVNDLNIAWKPAAGAVHYMVRVNDGARDTNYIVAPTASSMVHHGDGACTRYRVTVAAVAADKTQGATLPTTVQSLAPGSVTNIGGGRNEAGDRATFSWLPPSSPGYQPITGYDVRITQLSNGAVLVSRTSLDTVESITGIDRTRMYVAKVTARNAFGTCATSSITLGSNRPASPEFTVNRSTAQTSSAVVSWTPPRWQGYGPLTSYAIGYKNVLQKDFTWINTATTSRSLTIPLLDPTRDWQFVMRAISSDDIGLLSHVVILRRSGYTPKDATVVVSGGPDSITVDFSMPVGTSANFPRAKVSVARSNGTTGWSDNHIVTNGAGRVIFLPVPCGTWEVTVTGLGKTAAQELVRTTTRVCTPAPECFVSTLRNGDFEAPVLPARTYRFIPATTPGLAWQNTAEPVIEMWSTGFSGVPAPQGNQFAELNANKAGTLYQDLPTVPGTTMRWHLKHRGRSGTDTMRVMIGSPTGTLVQSGGDIVTPKTAWVQYTGTYKIPAGQKITRFAFRAVTAGSVGNFLDDVVFTPDSCQ